MSVLAAATVSDNDALAAVKSLDMSQSQRPGLWRQRWENSIALQREFSDVAGYVGYMEARATGRLRVMGRG